MKKSMLKNLLDEFIRIEESNMEKPTLTITHSQVGKLIILTPDQTYELPIVHVVEFNDVSDTSLIETSDGEVFIGVAKNVVDMIMENDVRMNLVWAVLAHEVGHYVSEHLNTYVTIDGINEGKSLDIRGRQHQIAIDRYLNNPTESNYRRYMLTLLTCLLRGACHKAEIEADIMACKFVGITDMIMCCACSDNKNNIFTALENHNAIQRLKKLQPLTAEERSGYNLELYIGE